MKGSGFISSSSMHRECWDLLPWFANERASARDVARMETHLRECDACRDELEVQRRLREAIRTEDAVVIAPQTSLQKLMQRIDAEDSGAESSEIATGAPPAHHATSRWSRLLPIAAAVQGIVITALLGALWWQSHQTLTAPRFTTLTSHTTLARGPVLRVVFAQGISLDEVNQLLHSIDAQIIAGPSEAGVYTLGFAARPARTAAVEQALAQLRSDARVVFSESAVARTESP